MNRDTIIQHILDTGLLTTCVDYQLKKQPQHYVNRDDILSDAWLWLLTYDIEKLTNAYLNNHLNAIITRYLQNQIFSKTSDYFRKYVKFNTLSEDLNNAKGIQSDI